MHPDSPIAAAMRAKTSRTKLVTNRLDMTVTPHSAIDIEVIVTRLPRSAQRAIGKPSVA